MSLGDYYSHFPILAAAVHRTVDPVLELGCGYGSTMMLHYMCCFSSRLLISADHDASWMEKFRPGYESKGVHEFHHVVDWDKWSVPEQYPRFGAVFIDNAPGHMRTPLAMRLKDRAVFLVLHDSERDHGTGANYEYEKLFQHFKYKSEFRRARPYTLILSNVTEFKIEECDKTWEQAMP